MSPTFENAGRDWLAALPTIIRRNGRPLSENTRRIYAGSFERLTERIGRQPLPVTNKALRDYVSWMRAQNYSSSSITGDLVVVKLVCESVRNDDGNPVYPLQLNHDFIATPIVNPDEQDAPVATREEVERALSVPEITGIVAIAGGAGLRISEILALKIGGDADGWDTSASAIHVRHTLKTPNAARTVFICEELNTWLRAFMKDAVPGSVMFPASLPELYRTLSREALPPFHSYRRFYATHRDELMMNEIVLKLLMGHSRGKQKDVTARYKKARLEFIKSELERVGLGFSLPALPAAAKGSGINIVTFSYRLLTSRYFIPRADAGLYALIGLPWKPVRQNPDE